MHDDHHLPDTVGGSAIRHTFFTTMGVQEIQHVHVVLLGGVHHWHHASFVFMIDVLRASVLIQKFHQCHMAVLGRQCHVGRGMVLGTGKSFPTQKNGGQSVWRKSTVKGRMFVNLHATRWWWVFKPRVTTFRCCHQVSTRPTDRLRYIIAPNSLGNQT